jgi:hypothetical protein
MTVRRSLPILLAALLAGGALVEGGPARAQVVGRPRAVASDYTGSYRASRQGADSRQVLTLVLNGDGSARQTTTYPGYTMTAAGTRIYPFVETGTWRVTQGLAYVRFTQSGQMIAGRVVKLRPDASETWFRLIGCTLNIARDPHRTYGTIGLSFKKSGCRS